MTAPGSTTGRPNQPLPKGPVLGWRSLAGARAPALPSVDDLPHRVSTTSGRAALYQALRALKLHSGDTVLVPTYHCPTMVAPVICAGGVPEFVAIGTDGLPRLDLLAPHQVQRARALIVAHYFGLVRDLSEVRRWCDAQRIVLIEDCAHALLGHTGGHAVGSWGDYVTASVSKFLPVSEMGLLATRQRPLEWQGLAPGLRAQTKGVVDVLEVAVRHGRPAGLAPLLAPMFRLKNRRLARAAAASGDQGHGALAGRVADADADWNPDAVDTQPAELAATRAEGQAMPSVLPSALAEAQARMLTDCDMARIEQAPVLVSRLLHRWLPRQRLVSRRKRHYDHYAELLRALPGARALQPQRPVGSAPYVFPLWVDDAERVYHRLRIAGLPVFRWDRLWPGTPRLAGDEGLAWSTHVLQLLCHQDLRTADIERVGAALHRELAPTAAAR
jgi:dTDP-4-amino-4,6-dideoxygalactose transaminase